MTPSVVNVALHNLKSKHLAELKTRSSQEPRFNDQAARVLLFRLSVKDTLPNLTAPEPQAGVDIVDLLEDMLFQPASSGIRPTLYLSARTDLECSMLMLLDETGDAQLS